MLKLGSGTGSLVNHVMSTGKGLAPEVGMGVTFLSWTDRHPGTIVEVGADKQGRVTFVTQGDNFKRIDEGGAFTEMQNYEFTPNPASGRQHWRQGKKGWEQVRFNTETNRWRVIDNGGIVVGKRDKYNDPCF